MYCSFPKQTEFSPWIFYEILDSHSVRLTDSRHCDTDQVPVTEFVPLWGPMAMISTPLQAGQPFKWWQHLSWSTIPASDTRSQPRGTASHWICTMEVLGISPFLQWTLRWIAELLCQGTERNWYPFTAETLSRTDGAPAHVSVLSWKL